MYVVYVHVCMHVCTYDRRREMFELERIRVCMCTFVYVCLYLQVFCICARMYVCMHTYTYTHKGSVFWDHFHLYTHAYIHTYIHQYIHTHIQFHTGAPASSSGFAASVKPRQLAICIFLCTHTHACIHTYIHQYIHTYIHTPVRLLLVGALQLL
jgi:hypothetical protein